MADKTPKQHLAHIAEKMKDIDFVMLGTHTKDGQIGHRPMSNNRQVDYDGDSYYFTWEDCLMVKDIEKDPKVGLSLQGASDPKGAPASSSRSRAMPRSSKTKRSSKSTGPRTSTAGSRTASTPKASSCFMSMPPAVRTGMARTRAISIFDRAGAA